MTVTLRFQSTGAIPGKGEPIVMIGPSLTLGRGDENDMVLPDPDRQLSKRHCVIENHNGNIVVVDISTNGTFLNYGKVPLGATPTPLNDGDILSLGPYELLVDIASDRANDPMANIADPVQDGPVSHGNAAAAPSTVELLDGPTGANDFLDDLLGGSDNLSGPRSVQRDELGEDGLLPPLGDDDGGLLPPLPDDALQGPQGGSAPSHNPSAQDHFTAPGVGAGAAVIPEDWDDLLEPTPSATPPTNSADPFAEPELSTPPPAPGSAPAFIPEDESDIFSAPHAVDPAIEAQVQDPVEETDEALDGVPTTPIEIEAPPSGPGPSPQAPTAAVPPERPAAPQPPVEATPSHAGAVDDETQAPTPPAAPRALGTEDSGRAFLKALGADELAINGDEMASTMARMGHVLRIMIAGMREILMTRTSIKSEFRIEQTMIRAGGNNPLKFSISPEQAVEALVKPSTRGYLDATEAAEEALQDIKAHEVAMVTGMEAALKGVLARLDPAVLEEKLQSGGGLSGLLKSKKARYWEIYETMYAEISDQAENDFQDLFSKEFAKAYREQLERLK